MRQVKTFNLVDRETLSSDFASSTFIEKSCEPIYIGAPTKLRLLIEVISTINVDPTIAAMAALSTKIVGAVNNNENSIWYQIDADSSYTDTLLQGTPNSMYVYRRFSEYQGTLTPGTQPLLMPWIRPVVRLARNSSSCPNASATYSLTIIAEYD